MEINNKFYPVLLMPNWVDKVMSSMGKEKNTTDNNKLRLELIYEGINSNRSYLGKINYKDIVRRHNQYDLIEAEMELKGLKHDHLFSEPGCAFGIIIIMFVIVIAIVFTIKSLISDSPFDFVSVLKILGVIIGIFICYKGLKQFNKESAEEEKIIEKIHKIKKDIEMTEEEREKEAQEERRRKEQQETYRLSKLKTNNKSFCDYAQKSFSPSGKFERSYDTPAKGYSEDVLFEALMKKKNNIGFDIKIDVECYGYYPDMVIECNNIYIDIEIDEPYAYENKQETHYIDSKDNDRNKVFQRNNWFVIRFSEKQIKTRLNECVEFIGKVCAICQSTYKEQELTKKGIDVYENTLNLEKLAQTIKDPRWTKEEARMMRINNYRDSY